MKKKCLIGTPIIIALRICEASSPPNLRCPVHDFFFNLKNFYKTKSNRSLYGNSFRT